MNPFRILTYVVIYYIGYIFGPRIQRWSTRRMVVRKLAGTEPNNPNREDGR